MRHLILFDCDPGIDDAVAFGLAAAHREELKLCGITTVAGNQLIERVTGNALKLAAFLGMDVPVARGASAPLLREVAPSGDIHGTTGLGNCVLPETERTCETEPAAVFMNRRLEALPPGEQMVLVPTGPLTNVALLLKTFPEASRRIAQIVLMGGAAVGGNVTATAEYNIWEDPEAAEIVFRSGIPIVMCGLDVTLKCGFTREQVERLKKEGGERGKAFAEMMEFYFHTPAYENRERIAIHDAVTFMYLLHPEIFSGKEMNVSIDCSEGKNRGMTVCDARAGSRARKNALVLLDVDPEKFAAGLMEALLSLDENS